MVHFLLIHGFRVAIARTRSFVACVATALWACDPASADAPYFQGLGDLPEGGYNSWAHGISRDGRVVVGATPSSEGFSTQAFYWTRETGMVGIGDFDGGAIESTAFGASADGKYITGSASNGDHYEAFRWSRDGGFEALGDLPGGTNGSNGYAISDDGSTVVGYSLTDRYGGDDAEAFIWKSKDGMKRLGDWKDGRMPAATDVSADGSVVTAIAFHKTNAQDAIRWTAEDGPVALEKFWKTKDASANAISADGKAIVGFAGVISKNGTGTLAFKWTEETGMVALRTGKFPNGHWESAVGVSDDGNVIVGNINAGDQAFIWDPENGIRELKKALKDEYHLDVGSWKITEAHGISGDGLTIIGNGISPQGKSEAWIAHIPEPSTAALLLAMIAIARYPRRGE